MPAIILLMIAALFFSCAPSTKTIVPIEKNVFRSKDYVVQRIKPGDTPEILAQKYLGDKNMAWIIESANPGAAFETGDLIAVPLDPKNKGGISEKGYQTVPILCYHRFADNCSSPLCMPADIFDSQMRYLKENGYRSITPEELLGFLQYKRPIPPKSIMITIDDGYRSVYDIAYPIMRQYGFTAVLFVYIDYVGISKKAITWDQLAEMKKNGFSVGSHSISHSDLSKKKKIESQVEYLERLQREILLSKTILDEKLEQDTFFFSYPFGRYNDISIEFAQKAGYKIASTVNRGGNPFFTNPFLLKRDQILKRDLDIFISRLKTIKSHPLK